MQDPTDLPPSDSWQTGQAERLLLKLEKEEEKRKEREETKVYWEQQRELDRRAERTARRADERRLKEQ